MCILFAAFWGNAGAAANAGAIYHSTRTSWSASDVFIAIAATETAIVFFYCCAAAPALSDVDDPAAGTAILANPSFSNPGFGAGPVLDGAAYPMVPMVAPSLAPSIQRGEFCTSCGQALDPGSAFCAHCGAPTGRAVPAPDSIA